MSKHVVEIIRCDMCDAESTEGEPVTTVSYAYGSRIQRQWEIDACPTHRKEIEDMFERLTESSRRVDQAVSNVQSGKKRKSGSQKQTLDNGAPKFDQWKTESDMYKCPGRNDDGSSCPREFSTPHALAVHHTRIHGESL